MECEVGGNNCVACSLNERAELLAILAPFAAKDGTEDTPTVLRGIIEALRDANELCRSMLSIAQRQGLQTNWAAFTKNLEDSLKAQHKVMYQPAPAPQPAPDADGEWRVNWNKTDIIDRNDRYVACATSVAHAARIVSDHSAIPLLVEALKFVQKYHNMHIKKGDGKELPRQLIGSVVAALDSVRSGNSIRGDPLNDALRTR